MNEYKKDDAKQFLAMYPRLLMVFTESENFEGEVPRICAEMSLGTRSQFKDWLSCQSELDFYNCNISDSGAKILAEELKTNFNIEKIYLSMNKISDRGAIVLARALAMNDNLKELILSANEISDPGAIAIAQFIVRTNKNLQELYLGDNRISKVGVVALAKALERNVRLNYVWLGRNQISSDIKEGFSEEIADRMHF